MRATLLSTLFVALLAIVGGGTLWSADETPPAATTTPAAAAPADAAPAATPEPAAETEPAADAAVAAPAIDKGDTAWMLVACALVLFMTLPGLALFYGGLVRAKNVLSVLMACFGIAGLISVLWAVYGYSLAFSDGGGANAIIGGLSNLFLKGVDQAAVSGTIPLAVFVMFQLTFAIITPALIVGAFAERMKFSAMLLFSAFWFTIVYLPICHMAWAAGGLFFEWGVLDFAGGTVVHINAGIAGLVAAVVIGKRKGYPTTPMKPHNLVLSAIGAGMLWIGWFGFNAGSALAANGTAGSAFLVTHLATAAAVVAWMIAEQIKHGKPSLLGAISGAVAGLVAITPAAGVAGPMGALLLGAISGFACFWGATSLKKMCGYDDALDAFGVHGVGGIVGAVLTAIVALPFFQGAGAADYDVVKQLGKQLAAVGITIAWTALISFILLKVIDVVVGLRVPADDENRGLDLAEHGEEAYNGVA